MKYETLYNYVKEKKFVIVDLKSGAVVLDGFVYDEKNVSWVQSDDLEGFDNTIDRYAEQMQSRHMKVSLSAFGGINVVSNVSIGTQSFVAGWMKRGGDTKMVSARGKEITLR